MLNKLVITYKMAKFTIHYSAGIYSGYSFKSKQKAIDKCNGFKTYATVQEEYLAPSPWNPNKITKHGKIVHTNSIYSNLA